MSTGETSPLNAKCKHIVANRKGVKAHWTGRPLHDDKLVIQTWVNSVALADVTDAESSQSGFIGLQVHGIKSGTGPFEVSWRNLYVKVLE